VTASLVRDLSQQPLSWLIGPARALIAPLRTARSARMLSAIPSRRLAGAVATPARTARAAASASIGSDVPRCRRVRRSGRSSSNRCAPSDSRDDGGPLARVRPRLPARPPGRGQSGPPLDRRPRRPTQLLSAIAVAVEDHRMQINHPAVSVGQDRQGTVHRCDLLGGLVLEYRQAAWTHLRTHADRRLYRRRLGHPGGPARGCTTMSTWNAERRAAGGSSGRRWS
jgi:hypothetical protein